MSIRFALARPAVRSAKSSTLGAFAVVVAAIAIAAPVRAGFDIFSVGGTASAASIQPTVDAFRAAIGGANNGNAGSVVGGRREINWDGGGATTATVSFLALTTFTNTRGATFGATGGLLQTPLDAPELTSIQPSYQTTFSAFSPLRVFTPRESNVTFGRFSLPGTNDGVSATTTAFGAVFSDVDLADTTKIEFRDTSNSTILTLNVPPGTVPNGSLSFIGAVANAGERIVSVRITTGNQGLGQVDSGGSPVDVVVMDDFIYAEPIVPEPAAATLALTALAAFGHQRRRLRRRVAV
jgi:hypothetical protein